MASISKLNELFTQSIAILQRRWLPGLFVIVTTLITGGFLLSQKTPVYRVEGHIIYEQDNKSLSLMGLTSLAKKLTQSGGWGDAGLTLETEKRIITSLPILEDTLNSLKTKYPDLDFSSSKNLKHQIKTTIVPSTKIIRITLDSSSPQLAKIIIDELMKVYSQTNFLSTKKTYAEARRFISQQLPNYKQKVISYEKSIRLFKERFGISDYAAYKNQLNSNISRIQGEIDDSEIQLSLLSTEYSDLQKRLNIDINTALQVVEINQSPLLSDYHQNLLELKRKLSDLEVEYKKNHPKILKLKDRIRIANKQFRSNFIKYTNSNRGNIIPPRSVSETQETLYENLIEKKTSIEASKEKLNKLKKQYNLYSNQILRLPRIKFQLNSLERELSFSISDYQSLNKNLQELQLSEKRMVPNVKVIEQAQASLYPVSPNKTAYSLQVIVVGLLLGTSTILLLEISDNRINRVNEIRGTFEYPLLCTIPELPKKSKQQVNTNLPMLSKAQSSLNEGYRVLQSNINLLISDRAFRIYALTSSVPQEGKSTTSANLALASAEIGYSTLLIDADLRRPSQHHIWELSNTLGLANILASRDIDITKTINRINSKLDVLTSGTIPPNPINLLASNRMSDFIHEMSSKYNQIIIDTPPIGVGTDTTILSKLVEGVVLVARPGVLTRNHAKFSLEIINQSNINIYGLVINGCKIDRESGYYYYYS